MVGYKDYDGSISTGTAIIGEVGEPPTAVTLSTFTATYTSDELSINWSTQSESNNAGWNIFRSDNECIEEALQVNGSLIAGAGTTSEPTDYIFYDVYPVETGSTYNYWLESRDYAGNTKTYGPVSLTVPQPGEDNPDNPNGEVYGLSQNFPNPFSNYTLINYNLPEPQKAVLTIYNTKGEVVRIIANNAADKGEFTWDGSDNFGNTVANGVYFYKLQAGKNVYTRKLILSK